MWKFWCFAGDSVSGFGGVTIIWKISSGPGVFSSPLEVLFADLEVSSCPAGRVAFGRLPAVSPAEVEGRDEEDAELPLVAISPEAGMWLEV
jgi:hypothetical protein